MKTAIKRILIGITGLACLTALGFVALVVYITMPPLRSLSRTQEKLPSVSIESGNTVYCRMRYCDFRFPLPTKARVVRTDPVTGDFNTIKGTIYVADHDGTPASLRAYAELLEKKRFHATPHNGGSDLFFGISESSNDGGSISATVTTDLVTEIHFSYFGDD